MSIHKHAADALDALTAAQESLVLLIAASREQLSVIDSLQREIDSLYEELENRKAGAA